MADGAAGGMFYSPRRPVSTRRPATLHGSFSTRSYPLPAALAGKPMHGILRQGGRLWFGCDQQLCMEQAGRISVFGTEQGLPEDAWDGIQISPDGIGVGAQSKERLPPVAGTDQVLAGEAGHRVERVLGRADARPRRLHHGPNRSGAGNPH